MDKIERGDVLTAISETKVHIEWVTQMRVISATPPETALWIEKLGGARNRLLVLETGLLVLPS